MLRRVIERLRELLFLGADHVLDIPAGRGHLVVLLPAAGDRLQQPAVGE